MEHLAPHQQGDLVALGGPEHGDELVEVGNVLAIDAEQHVALEEPGEGLGPFEREALAERDRQHDLVAVAPDHQIDLVARPADHGSAEVVPGVDGSAVDRHDLVARLEPSRIGGTALADLVDEPGLGILTPSHQENFRTAG